MSIFFWLAGVDSNVVEKFSPAERTKLSGQGAIVLMPAIVGIFSMSYAVSTLTDIK